MAKSKAKGRTARKGDASPEATTESKEAAAPDAKASTSKKQTAGQKAIAVSPVPDLTQYSWWYRHCGLGFFAFVNMPMYGMLIHSTLYAVVLYYSADIVRYLQTFMVLYLAYCFFDETPRKCGYSWWSNARMESLRRIWFLKAFAQYFPVQLVKTVELPATKKVTRTKRDGTTVEQEQAQTYLFSYHPHGVIGVGACAALYSNACGFDVLFPGLKRRSVTLNVCFWAPIFREWALLLGLVSANKGTLMHCLRDRGESVVLLPGGATEALYAQPDTFQLYLKQRKGFVKLALETNVPVVPCLGFGENQAFGTVALPKSSWAGQFQQWLCHCLSFSLPLMTSPWPRPRPIHVVVGEPVHFRPDTTVNECHAQYLQALQALYDQHKAQYGHEHIALEIC